MSQIRVKQEPVEGVPVIKPEPEDQHVKPDPQLEGRPDDAKAEGLTHPDYVEDEDMPDLKPDGKTEQDLFESHAKLSAPIKEVQVCLQCTQLSPECSNSLSGCCFSLAAKMETLACFPESARSCQATH